MNHIYKTILTVVSFFSAMSAGAANYVITDYGVIQDSTVLQTKAIQNVIDSAEAQGGGKIIVPRGTYLTGALFFKKGTKLELQEGAVLKGSDNIEDYPLLPSRMEGKNIYYYAALINAYYVKGFSIEGPGTVNGNGLKFWKRFWARRSAAIKAKKPWTNLEVHRPRLVFVWGCDSITFKGAKFINSGYWTTHFYQCNDILIENCEMLAPRKPVRAPSTDAIDLDVCKNVVIRGCYLSSDDDGVCIKGGKGPLAHKGNENGIVENVLVEDCSFGPSLHGVLTMGSEAIHAKNITLRNCKLNTGCSLLRLKMRPDTYQIYEDITIENVTGTCGSVIDMKYWSQFFSLEGTNEHPYGIVRNIKLSNVDVDCDNFIYMKGNKNDKVSKVVLENVTARTHKTDKIVNAYKSATKMKNVVVNGNQSASIYMSKEYMLKDTSYSKKLSPEEGKTICRNIQSVLHKKSDFEKRKKEIKKQILLNTFLNKFPQNRKIDVVVNGKQTVDGYTVENIALEVLPGVWTYGNVYRPLDGKKKHPAMILAQGHSKQEIGPNCGRMSNTSQTIAASLAKMGAVVFSYDMFGYGESGEQVGVKAHYTGIAQSMNLLGARAAIDWLVRQADVDASRIGITGASGGGTQTFYTTAIDNRIALSVPVVMVSSFFPGGCACESGRPIHTSVTPRTCNAEIAALAVPRPMLVISDGKDWTRMVDKLEFPFIQGVYSLYGKKDKVENVHLVQEGHNYGPNKRYAMYDFVGKYFGIDTSVMKKEDGTYDESKVRILPYESLLVFHHHYPAHSLTTPAQVYDQLVKD